MDIEQKMNRVTLERMVRAYATLSPMTQHNPNLRWEMTKETAESLAKEFVSNSAFSAWGPIEWKQWIEDHKEEITFMAVRVILVERPGIRLVVEVIV